MTTGVLIVEGMELVDAVRVVERHGGIVHNARKGATPSSTLLDVSMTTAAANAIAVALVGVVSRLLNTTGLVKQAS